MEDFKQLNKWKIFMGKFKQLNKWKIFSVILIVAIIFLLGKSLSYKKIVEKKEHDLEFEVQSNVQHLHAYDGDGDEELYVNQQYEIIVSAQEALKILNDKQGAPAGEIQYSLTILLDDMKITLMNDKEKYSNILKKEENYTYVGKIYEDINDKESIHKLYMAFAEK